LMEGFQRQTAPPVAPEHGEMYQAISTDRFSAETLVDLFLYGAAVR